VPRSCASYEPLDVEVRGFHSAVGAQSTEALHCTAGGALPSATIAGVT